MMVENKKIENMTRNLLEIFFFSEVDKILSRVFFLFYCKIVAVLVAACLSAISPKESPSSLVAKFLKSGKHF